MSDDLENMMWLLYIVETEHPLWVYVGVTTQPEIRWKQHRTGKGSAFTKAYGATRFHAVEILMSGTEAKKAERRTVLRLKKQGYKAAGGAWCQADDGYTLCVVKGRKLKPILTGEPLFTWT